MQTVTLGSSCSPVSKGAQQLEARITATFVRKARVNWTEN